MFVVEKWDTGAVRDDISKGISEKLPKLKSSKTKSKRTSFENVDAKITSDRVQNVDDNVTLPKGRKRKSGKNKFQQDKQDQKLVGADVRSAQHVPASNLKRKTLSPGGVEAKSIKIEEQPSATQKQKPKRKKKRKAKNKDSTDADGPSVWSPKTQQKPCAPSDKSIVEADTESAFHEISKCNSAVHNVNEHSHDISKQINVNKLRGVLTTTKVMPLKEKKQEKTSDKQKKNMSLADRMREKLTAARFRYLNEQLYTQTGSDAQELFQEDPDAFRVYHEGFESQVTKWPSNPAERVIKYIRRKGAGLVVADFGCGDAKVAQALPNTVHSFDLVAINSHVTACDMSNVPLGDASADVCVFCLSLMGTNLVDYLCEASRVLKQGGTLLVAEVVSRFDSTKRFVKKLEKLGFSLVNQDDSEKMFVWFELRKMRDPPTGKNLPEIELAPCTYKKR